jgi:hypothetical protein
MKSYSTAFLGVVAISILGCSEVKPPAAPPPAAPEPAVAESAPPAPLLPAPKALGRLILIPSSDSAAALGQPVSDDDAGIELVRHDSANEVSTRCTAPTGVPAAKPKSIVPRLEEVEAEPLKTGMIPTMMTNDLINQLTENTRVWQLESKGLDFYQTLSGRAQGLDQTKPAVACLRYSLFRPGTGLYSDMLFSVTYNPKSPEVLTVKPVRLYYRDFASLADRPGANWAAVRVTLDMRTYALDRTAGRVASPMQNQEMAVELIANPGAGRALYQLYDPIDEPTITLPMPPWDYSASSINPRHNLSMLGIKVTEIADFEWLQSQRHNLWRGWEDQATDVAKLTLAAQFYRRTHKADLTNP